MNREALQIHSQEIGFLHVTVYGSSLCAREVSAALLCTLSGCTPAMHQYGCARTRSFVFSLGTLVRLLALSCFSCSVMGSMSERMPQRIE
jgi:hypothetical protein